MPIEVDCLIVSAFLQREGIRQIPLGREQQDMSNAAGHEVNAANLRRNPPPAIYLFSGVCASVHFGLLDYSNSDAERFSETIWSVWQEGFV